MTIVTHQATDELWRVLRRHGVPTLLATGTIAFFLPFGTVSCDGETVHFTGLQLATKTVPSALPRESYAVDVPLDRQVEDEAGSLALIALVFATLGVGAATYRGSGGGFAVAALLSLVLLLLDAALSFAEVQIEVGYWLALTSVTTAALLRARSRWRARRERLRHGPRRLPSDEWVRRHLPTWLLGLCAVGVILFLEALTPG